MTTPVLSAVESDRHQEPAKNYQPDWIRLFAMFSWLRARPNATFDEFLSVLPRIDHFMAMTKNGDQS